MIKSMKNLFFKFSFVCITLFGIHACSQEVQEIYLSDMDYSLMISGWQTTKADSSVTGRPLTINKVTYERGLGTHAPSEMTFEHDGSPGRFLATVGVDDFSDKGSLEFIVFTDKGIPFRSGMMTKGDSGIDVDVNLRGVRQLSLVVDTGRDGYMYDHANWAEARFVGAKIPVPIDINNIVEEPYMLTPPAPKYPRINGAKIYGVTPGKPFLFRVATTGERPISFSAVNCPEGLHLNPETGIISGISPPKGVYEVIIKAENKFGKCEEKLKIASEGALALTPHMGWNGWYIHMREVTQKHMEEAAVAMVESGMADYGYCYVNIDAGWAKSPGMPNDPVYGSPMRAEDGTILCNKKFPDIRAFTVLVHSLGLKAGIYSSPSNVTCADFVGAYGHEAQDAKTFSDWGFDFLKYDWCSYGTLTADRKNEPDYYRNPFSLMGNILKEQERDIVFNLCQYGMDNVWEWGKEAGGHSWRIRGDIGHGGLLSNLYSVGLSQSEYHKYSGPGGWNDPDYILIGTINNIFGTTNESTPGFKQSPLSPSTQYTYMTMWSMLAAPLIFSGDMTQLDEFTLNILCNNEVIEVNQDELGAGGYCISSEDLIEVWEKPLYDGTYAVAVFNRRPVEYEIKVDWNVLNYGNATEIRDIWRQKNIRGLKALSGVKIPRNGCAMYRMKKNKVN